MIKKNTDNLSLQHRMSLLKIAKQVNVENVKISNSVTIALFPNTVDLQDTLRKNYDVVKKVRGWREFGE